MRILHKVPLGLGLLLPMALVSQTASSNFRFTLGNVTLASNEVVLDYGQILADQPFETAIEVQNARDSDLVVDAFVVGRGLRVAWKVKNELTTRLQLRPGEEGTLLVFIEGRLGNSFPSVLLMENWHELAHLDVLYLLTPPQELSEELCFPQQEDCVPGQDSGQWYTSGVGGSGNHPYRACTSEPSPGLEIEEATPFVWSSSTDSKNGDTRACPANGKTMWAHCDRIKGGQGEGICFNFSVQGHQATVLEGRGKDRTVQFRARISVKYKAARPTVILRTADEVKKK